MQATRRPAVLSGCSRGLSYDVRVITVDARSAATGWECDVRVDVGGSSTRHRVGVGRDDLGRWGRPGETPDHLVRRAFEFLLAREPRGQILRSFQLADIQRYFPEFDSVISLA